MPSATSNTTSMRRRALAFGGTLVLTAAVAAAVQAPLVAQAGEDATTTSASVSPANVLSGQPYTISVGVTSTNGPIPDGTVGVFWDSASTESDGVGTLDSTGRVDIAATSWKAGTHTLYVNYSGDRKHLSSSTTVDVTCVCTPGLTLQTSPTSVPDGGMVTLTAQLAADGAPFPNTVGFEDGNGETLGVVTPDSNGTAVVHAALSGGGSHSITAGYPGDVYHTSAFSDPINVDVTCPCAIQLSLGSTATTVDVGQTVAFTASLTADGTAYTSAVQFFDGSSQLGSAPVDATTSAATLSTQFSTPGSHQITAYYPGDAAHRSATSSPVWLTVLSPTSTAVSPNPYRVDAGWQETLSATVTSQLGTPTGVVDYYDSTTYLGSASLDATGVARLTTSFAQVGYHLVTAQYRGDNVNDPSTSAPATVAVAGPSSTSVTASPSPTMLGQYTTVTATVIGSTTAYAPTGTVMFYDGNTIIGSGSVGSSGTVSISVQLKGVGQHWIHEGYYGDDLDLASFASTYVSVLYPTTTSLTATPSIILAGAPVALQAQVASSGGTPAGTVAFYDGSALLGSATLDSNGKASLVTTSITAPGPNNVTAVYQGNASYAASTSAAQTVTVLSA